MKKPLVAQVALAALFLVSLPLLGQQKKKPASPPPQSGGVTISTNPTPPPGAKEAEVQDVRVLEKSPDDPYEYERYGLGAYNANDLAHARGFFEKSWQFGELPTAAYNLACVDLKEGKTDAAWAHLEKAVAVGYDDERELLNDPDLASIRGQSRFGAIVSAARKNRSEGDASVVKEGTFVAPQGRPVGVLVILHDASSDPLSASAPFLDAARARGLFVAVPRGPARAGKKRFGWGTKERALAAVAAASDEGKRRAGNPALPVFLVGVGRGGTLALTAAAQRAGAFAGVGSVGGPYDPGAGNTQQAASEAAALRGVRIYTGVPQDAPQGLVAAIGRGIDALKKYGLNPVLRYWAGSGSSFPSKNAAAAAKETLDGVLGTGAAPR